MPRDSFIKMIKIAPNGKRTESTHTHNFQMRIPVVVPIQYENQNTKRPMCQAKNVSNLVMTILKWMYESTLSLLPDILYLTLIILWISSVLHFFFLSLSLSIFLFCMNNSFNVITLITLWCTHFFFNSCCQCYTYILLKHNQDQPRKKEKKTYIYLYIYSKSKVDLDVINGFNLNCWIFD